jgi:hypothetical protein
MDGYLAKAARPVGSEVSKPVKRVQDAYPKTLRELQLMRQGGYEIVVQGAAVMHYHRALALRALGRNKEADAEVAVARRMIGREPDETLF